jgi:epoxyqueuosine reductase
MAGGKDSLLLHACCAPCSTHPIRLLSERYDVAVFFFNPNIQPFSEYEARQHEMEQLARRWAVPFLKGPYDEGLWTAQIRGRESDPEGGLRCRICYRFRLERTARKALEEGYTGFGTTLSVSPHKNAAIINRIGKDVGSRICIPFFEADFKKKDGFKISGRISREEGLYRQNYCGCRFSRRPPSETQYARSGPEGRN